MKLLVFEDPPLGFFPANLAPSRIERIRPLGKEGALMNREKEKKVLCIDDDGLLSVTCRQLALKKAGFDVVLAYNAVRGMQLFAAQRFTLVILCGSFCDDSEAMVTEMKRQQPAIRVVRHARYAKPAVVPPAADVLLADA